MRRSLRYAAILGFVGFVTSFGAHIVAVNLPTYAAAVGVGLAMIGLLIAIYDIAEILAKPVFGALADKQGMKRTMLAGIGVFTLASLLYLVIDPRLLLIVRFMQGLGAAALSAVSLALVGVYYGEHRGRAYGVYNALKGAGYVIAPITGGLIIARTTFAAIFLATAAIGAVAFLISLSLPAPEQKPADVFDDDDEFSWAGFFSVFGEPSLRPWFAVTVVNMFFVGILFGFVPVRIHALGYGPVPSGILLTVVAASYLLIQPVAGYLADKVDPALTIRLGLVAAGVSIIVVPFVSGAVLLVLSVIAGFGVGTVWTNTDALVSGLARSGKMGATMGAAGSFKELGDMVGPLLIGVVSQAFGLSVGFVACGVLGLLSLVLIRRTTITPVPKRASLP